jgi:hypothetical protein
MAARLTWVAERINLEAPGNAAAGRYLEWVGTAAPRAAGTAAAVPVRRAMVSDHSSEAERWAPFHLLFAAC